jgi:GTPase SAR1 family protein
MGNKKNSKNNLKYEEDNQKKFKIMIMGTGEAGKTTFFNQIKKFNKSEYLPEELKFYKLTIYSNIYCFNYF